MKCSASLWLAISSAGNQDVRANFMNERYINWYTPWLSRDFEMLVFGEKHGYRYWRDMLPYYLSKL
jgi:hypothetical protein